VSGPGWPGLRRSRSRRLRVRAGGRRGQQAGELADGFRVAVQAQVAGPDGIGDRALAEDHGGQGAGVGGEDRGGLARGSAPDLDGAIRGVHVHVRIGPAGMIWRKG